LALISRSGDLRNSSAVLIGAFNNSLDA